MEMERLLFLGLDDEVTWVSCHQLDFGRRSLALGISSFETRKLNVFFLSFFRLGMLRCFEIEFLRREEEKKIREGDRMERILETEKLSKKIILI